MLVAIPTGFEMVAATVDVYVEELFAALLRFNAKHQAAYAGADVSAIEPADHNVELSVKRSVDGSAVERTVQATIIKNEQDYRAGEGWVLFSFEGTYALCEVGKSVQFAPYLFRGDEKVIQPGDMEVAAFTALRGWWKMHSNPSKHTI